MDFVDKKKSICTLGDFCSYRAVSSKLPIAIIESALYRDRRDEKVLFLPFWRKI